MQIEPQGGHEKFIRVSLRVEGPKCHGGLSTGREPD